MKFVQPFFVTPHAVKRFQERIADIPAAKVIEAVQALLQDPGESVDREVRDGKVCDIYRGEYGSVNRENGDDSGARKPVYIPVIPAEGAERWPVVPTILNERAAGNGVWKEIWAARKRSVPARGRAKRDDVAVDMQSDGVGSSASIRASKKLWTQVEQNQVDALPSNRYWTQAEQDQLDTFRRQGLSIRECAKRLGRSHTTVERHVKKTRPHKRWTEAEREELVRLLAAGAGIEDAAKTLGRSVNAVEIELSRERKTIPRAAQNGRPWTEAEQQKLASLLGQGLSLRECGRILGRDHHTIRRYVAPGLFTPRPQPWTEKERDMLVRLHAVGRSLDYIARRLGRSKGAVERMLCRHKKQVRDNPAMRRVMQVLAFCFDPGRVLKAVRDSDILPELAERDNAELDGLLEDVRRGW